MKTADQRGMSHLILVLLLLLVLGGAGFAGWRVYQANQDKKDASQTPTNTQQENTPPADTLPNGFVEYKNEELKFSFAYPSAWGDVELDTDTTAVSGELYMLAFSDNDKVIAELMTSDYETGSPSDRFSPAFTDHAAAVKQVKDANRERLAGNNAYATNVLKDHTTNLMYASFDCLGTGYYIATMRGFAEGAPTVGIGFLFQNETVIAAACDNPGSVAVSDYVDKTVQAQLDQVMGTVKEL